MPTVRVSNSEIQTAKTCRRKWYLAYYLRLQRQREFTSPVGARDLGSKIHVALCALYERHENPVQVLRDLYDADIAYWRDVNQETYVDALTKEYDLAYAMIAGYVEWVETTGADEDYEVTAAEEVIEVPSGVEGVHLIGKIDTRVVRRSDHARLFMDHKTVGDLTTPHRTLRRDEQMRLYHLLEKLDAHYRRGDGDPPEPTGGALYNMLRKVKRTDRARPPFYGRIEISHNRREIEVMWERVHAEILWLLEMRRQLDEGGSHQTVCWPRPSRDCTWACDYEPFCSLMDDGSDWEGLVRDYYEPGDPMSRYSEALAVQETERA